MGMCFLNPHPVQIVDIGPCEFDGWKELPFSVISIVSNLNGAFLEDKGVGRVREA